MGDEYARLIAAWREADRLARQAQDELDAQLESFINEDGPVPSEAQRARVGDLRRIASDRLTEVLSHLAQQGGTPPKGQA